METGIEIANLRHRINVGIDEVIIRNAYKGTSWKGWTQKQMLEMFVEEFGEYKEAFKRGDPEGQKVEILDMIWVLMMQYDLVDSW